MKISKTAVVTITIGLMGAGAGCSTSGSAATDAKSAGAGAAGYANAERLPERLAANGTTIVVGNPTARSTVQVLEDPRCPVVEEYERTGAPALNRLLLDGEIKAEYTFASFKDIRLGGDGSKRAVNALRAALDKGKFVEFHAVLFEKQAAVERGDGFTTHKLLELADEVPGLRDKTFDQAVKSMKYKAFVTASEQAYEHTGADPKGPGTPTVIVNSHAIDGGLYGANFDTQYFYRMVKDLHEYPYTWDAVYKPIQQEPQDQA